MEPEPERVDLSSLDPSSDAERWQRAVATVATRGQDRRRLRRAIARRGAIAIVLAAAAGIAVWWSAPRPEVVSQQAPDILDWAVRDVQPSEVLGMGVGNAH
jgi:hypothetical protein